MTMSSWVSAGIGLIAIVVTSYVGGCSFISRARSDAFDRVQVGDLESVAIAVFGVKPTVRETASVPFARYASKPCSSPCIERLWFENRLSLDTEAWSIEIDANGRVVKKTRWTSP